MIDDEQTRVWVIDTSSILRVRRMYDPAVADSQYRVRADHDYCITVLDHLKGLVREGRVTFPKQVKEELYKPTSHDLASQWVFQTASLRRYPEPSLDVLASVLTKVPRLADPTKSTEDADPYIVALALELLQKGALHALVTEDVRDRRSTSIATACATLGIPWLTTLQFLVDCGAPEAPG